MEVGEEGDRYTVTTRMSDSCIKMGSDESHFNVSIGIVMDKVTRQCPQTTTFEVTPRKESRSRFSRTVVPLLTSLTPSPLGQTGSHLACLLNMFM